MNLDVNFLKQNGVDVDKSLELFGDMEIYNETFQDYLNGIDEKKSNLAKFKNLANWADYAIFAHSIKSDARYLGFTKVAEVCLKHEMAGKEQNQHFIETDYDHLLKTVDGMTDIVKRYLAGEKAGSDTNAFVQTPDMSHPIESTKTINIPKESVILIADDSPLIGNFASRILEPTYKVVLTQDGKQTIDLIDANRYNIEALLLDLNMPNVGGFEVLEYLKTKNIQVPTSIITGEDSKDMINKAFTYNIVDMLVKPFSKDELLRVVEKTKNYNL